MNANALPDDPDWCGHAMVSLRTWACADCDRPVTEATRRRLERSPTLAPPGRLWVLERAEQDESDRPTAERAVDGLFTDRARIARLLVRHRIVSAAYIRDVLRRTHWYQGAYNDRLFEGWAEETNEGGGAEYLHLSLYRVDAPWG